MLRTGPSKGLYRGVQQLPIEIEKKPSRLKEKMYEEVKFSIKIKEPAEKWLRKYDKEVQKRFATKIRKLKENPEIHGKPLRGVLHGYWELYFERRYRIIYTIDYKEQIVTIEAIKHKDEL